MPRRKLAGPEGRPIRRYPGAMSRRILYIAAYDISNPARLRQGLRVLKDYATGRQKSVFECFLSAAEKHTLLSQMGAVIDRTEDRFFLLRLDPRSGVRTFGKAVKPEDSAWFYVG